MESGGKYKDSRVPRRDVVLATAAAAAMALQGAEAAEVGPVVVKGVDRYRVYDPAFECVRVALAARGERYSSDYVQGISGAGFRMGGPCPCAPTCTMAMSQADLVRLLGYETEELTFGDGDRTVRLEQIVQRIKQEIRAGRPVIVFHAFTTAEWDVVCGYDDATHEFVGRGAYGSMLGKDYVRADQGRMVTCADMGIAPPLGALFIGAKTRRFDARKAEKAAIREALRHARDTARKDYPFDGIAVYDRWRELWRAEDAKPEWTRDGYISAVYSSTHLAGSRFLRSMARRYRNAAPELTGAANRLEAESKALHDILALLFPGQGKPSPDPDAVRATVRKLVDQARSDYMAMADHLEKAVRLLA